MANQIFNNSHNWIIHDDVCSTHVLYTPKLSNCEEEAEVLDISHDTVEHESELLNYDTSFDGDHSPLSDITELEYNEDEEELFRYSDRWHAIPVSKFRSALIKPSSRDQHLLMSNFFNLAGHVFGQRVVY